MEALVKSHPLILTIAFYLFWVAATYLFEGQLRTFLKPQETALRTRYTLVANWGIGLVLTGWLLSLLVEAGRTAPDKAGFQSAAHALIAVIAGAVLGFVAYLAQKPPTRRPIILLNGYAQVLTVSIAEVLVCWGLLGSVVEGWLQTRGIPFPTVVAGLVAAAAFGFYHIAHSPPFNSIRMIALLAVIGLVTSLFFFISRDVYGTIVFHNFLGLFGVLTALHASGKLSGYERLIPPALAMALVSIVLLVLVHAVLL